MDVLIADHNKITIAAINECNPSFDVELGMTGLGSGVGGLDRREAAKKQVQGIEDALIEIAALEAQTKKID